LAVGLRGSSVQEFKHVGEKAQVDWLRGCLQVLSLALMDGPSDTIRTTVQAITLFRSVKVQVAFQTLSSPWKRRETHKRPRLNRMPNPTFCALGSCNRTIWFMGRTMIATSAAMVKTELAYQTAPMLMHLPSSLLFHALEIGLGILGQRQLSAGQFRLAVLTCTARYLQPQPQCSRRR